MARMIHVSDDDHDVEIRIVMERSDSGRPRVTSLNLCSDSGVTAAHLGLLAEIGFNGHVEAPAPTNGHVPAVAVDRPKKAPAALHAGNISTRPDDFIRQARRLGLAPARIAAYYEVDAGKIYAWLARARKNGELPAAGVTGPRPAAKQIGGGARANGDSSQAE